MTLRAIVVLCLAHAVSCQTHAPPPKVPPSAFSRFDLGRIKSGEWVQYRYRCTMGTAPELVLERWACVGATAERIVIEVSRQRGDDPNAEELVVAHELDRATGEILAAWRGTRGRVGETDAAPMVVAFDEPAFGHLTAKHEECVVSRETLELLGRPWDCDRVEKRCSGGPRDATDDTGWSSHVEAWYSPAAPFPLREVDAVAPHQIRDGARARPGGLVRRVSRLNHHLVTPRYDVELVAMGADAQATLTRPGQ